MGRDKANFFFSLESSFCLKHTPPLLLKILGYLFVLCSYFFDLGIWVGHILHIYCVSGM